MWSSRQSRWGVRARCQANYYFGHLGYAAASAKKPTFLEPNSFWFRIAIKTYSRGVVMKQFAVTVTLLSLLIAIDASAETRQLNFTDFDEVSVGHGMRVSINQGAMYRVEATGSAADLDRLRVNHRDSRLTFSIDPGFWGVFQSGRISLNITLPGLRKLDLSGGSDGTLDVQRGSSAFAASLSGGSRLSGQLTCGAIQLSLSGGSRVALSGTGKSLVLDGSGGSEYELK